MNNQQLNDQIRALTATLARTPQVDKNIRELLIDLRSHINRLAVTEESDSVTERLEELAVRFEADHPSAGTAIRQVIDTLVKAGI